MSKLAKLKCNHKTDGTLSMISAYIKDISMEIKQYDTVLLKDGRKASIVEVFDQNTFNADVGTSSKDWETIDIKKTDIDKILIR